MNYIECKVNITTTEQSDLITSILGEIGFESFIEENNFLHAYIPSTFSLQDQEFVSTIKSIFDEYKLDNSFELKIIEQQNWNSTWESNFEPIVLENKCIVRAPFHKPQNDILEIVIEPKMSFGTGHHQTTYLMLEALFDVNLDGKTILDMGCGTAILAILAEKLNASKIIAIDIEEWAYENAIENVSLNSCKNIEVLMGGVEVIPKLTYDIVIANINKNVLLSDIKSYVNYMKKDSLLLLSGFFVTDSETLINECKKYDLELQSIRNKEEWCMLKLIKN